jgi:tRNA pseudouridine55 synthase
MEKRVIMRTAIDGLLIVDKPDGITSLAVVKEVKRRLRAKKAGHIGTLDPFATGVLPIAINEGTKLVPFLKEEPKEYEAVLKLGEETATDDLTGEVLYRKKCEGITSGIIHEAFQMFQGKIQQIPPMFSAIKVQGKPLYQLARKGIEVERKEREVEIYDIQIEEIILPQVRFKVSCSKGTYIRTLGRDIGRKLGCGAHLLHLRRVRSGFFTIQRAIPWKKLEESHEAEDLSPWLISLGEALVNLPEVIGNDDLVKMVRNGKMMAIRDLSPHMLPAFEKGEWLKMSSSKDGLVAVLKSEVRDTDIQVASPEVVALRALRVFRPNGMMRRLQLPLT